MKSTSIPRKTTKAGPPTGRGGWWTRAALLTLLGLFVLSAGCRTRSGSREFIPGKGWVPN